MALRADDFVCLADEHGLEQFDRLINSKYTAKNMGTLVVDTGDSESLIPLNRVFRAKHDHQGELLEIESDMRHAPILIEEAGGKSATESANKLERNCKTERCWMEGRVQSCRKQEQHSTDQLA